ncbi:hypothetical protein TH61_10925 [Rufibacter sp. DG15C]|uniref:YceI family protein n=1 Tax=Rufibacter sp. DG15C TaxID=1379909 RepID=UPI00078CB378|nr:YceI family protein [Rufibacter sp. DG15C]AMM51584.1 hypothetical protein TH61_10925 [Rufibacter sp. DG15C]
MKAAKFSSRNIFTFFFCMILLEVAFPKSLSAQTVYSTHAGKAGTVKVSGTSDLQTWTVTSTEAESQGVFTLDEKNQMKAISQLQFTLKANSLQGGLKIMDHKAHKALKASKYPVISFQLESAVVLPIQANQQVIHATGSLTLKGVTHTITLPMLAVLNSDRSFTITGTKALRFSDYLIKAPSFMGGAMQAGNDITVDILLTYLPPQTQVLAENK